MIDGDQGQDRGQDDGVVNRRVEIATLTPHPRNYNTHPEPQLRKIRASIARFGQVRSIVVQEGAPGKYLIVAGHGFVEAATKEGKRTLRADVIPADWSPAQVEGYLMADNLTARDAEPDDEMLADMLEEQANAGYDLASVGSSRDELDELLDSLTNETERNGEGGEESDDANAPSDGSLLALLNVTIADPSHKVQAGQVWELGPHLLFCCDVATQWGQFKDALDGEGTQLAVYAGPLVALSNKAQTGRVVLVQPDTYIAGHILDRYAEVNGDDSVRCRNADQ